ncbi:MAG: lipoyl(octanoyl) transferase LipB [Cyanobacteria bacterium J06659_2]
MGTLDSFNTQTLTNGCWLYSLGQVPFETAWDWQQHLLQQRLEDSALPDVLLILEHPPTYTLGQGADPQFLKFDLAAPPAAVYRIERGGEVTYHCPGQLVGYPILNLRRHRQDLHWYLRQLEEVIIRAIAIYGLSGERVEGLTGVWVEGYKVAAIGIKVSRWITMHGFALNVCPDLSGFDMIVPCGIANRPVGSLQQFIPQIRWEQVQHTVARCFSEVFQLQLFPGHDINHVLTKRHIG